MKIIFAGTPDFAAAALRALIASKHEIVAVYTQPDRPAGRGLHLKASAVKELALAHDLPIFQPVSLKPEEEVAQLKAFNADVMVVAAYGMLLPAAVLSVPPLGCINIHPSLLPRWRGAAPIQRTIHAGDAETGVTIMQMDVGLDTGPILFQTPYTPTPDETSATLHDVLAPIGAQALLETLAGLQDGTITPIQQDNAQTTYAGKISKEEALIDWSQEAIELEREVRAFNPFPISHTSWQLKSIRIWRAKAIEITHNKPPRTILHASKEGIDVAAGKGALRLLQVQLAGGKVISIADFYNAHQHDLIIGQTFL